MIYIGNFKFFESEVNDQELRHGTFTCLVEAENIEKALDIFGTHLLRTQKTDRIFANSKEIYIDEIIGVSKAPKKAIITSFRFFCGELDPSERWVLPEGSFSGINAYEWQESGIGQKQKRDGSHEVVPFITF